MKKPMLLATLFAASGGDKKKSSRRKPLPSKKGKSSTTEICSRAFHDMPYPPLKRKKVFNIDNKWSYPVLAWFLPGCLAVPSY